MQKHSLKRNKRGQMLSVFSDEGLLGFVPSKQQRTQLSRLPLHFLTFDSSEAMLRDRVGAGFKITSVSKPWRNGMSKESLVSGYVHQVSAAKLRALPSGLSVWNSYLFDSVLDAKVVKDAANVKSDAPVLVWDSGSSTRSSTNSSTSSSFPRLLLLLLPRGSQEWVEQQITDAEFVSRHSPKDEFLPASSLESVMRQSKDAVHLTAPKGRVSDALHELIQWNARLRTVVAQPEKTKDMDESKGDPPAPKTWVVALFVGLMVLVIVVGIALYLKYGGYAPDRVVVNRVSTYPQQVSALDDVERLLKTWN